jgi:hypothetical protein
MTLKEKFKLINCSDCDMPYCEIKCTILKPSELIKLEQIADEFAIGFAEWLNKGKFSQYGNSWINPKLPKNSKGDWVFFTSKELLEIYKKEKGL